MRQLQKSVPKSEANTTPVAGRGFFLPRPGPSANRRWAGQLVAGSPLCMGGAIGGGAGAAASATELLAERGGDNIGSVPVIKTKGVR